MIASVLICAAFALGADAPSKDFDAFFRDFTAQRAAVKVLDATFIQTTILPEEKLATRGTLEFAQPRRFVIRTEDPKRETLLVGQRGYEYEAALQQVLMFDIERNAEASIFFLGFDDDAKALRAAYEVSLFDTPSETRGKRGVLIKPKAASENKLFQEVSLYLRDEDTLPYRIRIVNDAQSTIILDLDNLRVNPPVPTVAPSIIVPAGVKIVENDKVIETVGAAGKRLPEAVPVQVPMSESQDLAPAGAKAGPPPPPVPPPNVAPTAAAQGKK